MSGQTILAPSAIGKYKFKKTIGEGAFSVVKMSINIETDEFLACKIVPRSSLNCRELEDRFEVEIRINQQLHHPGIVQIVDLLKDEMNYYIFMEFCPNGELFQYIVERQKLPENEAVIILHQILTTLNYVHSLGIAHRDLKPENLLLSVVGSIKISDFGLSRFVENSGLVQTSCGSPCYASPECHSGRPYDGRKSDMWSLGVILYAMVTGQLPWTKRNQAQLFKQIRNGDYIVPSYLSKDCKDMIIHLMDTNPETRFSAEDALKHPFVAGITGDFDGVTANYNILSLKKVDQFFGKSITDLSLPNPVSDDDLGFPSQRPADVNFVVRAIKKSSKVPRLSSIDRNKSYDLVQKQNMGNLMTRTIQPRLTIPQTYGYKADRRSLPKASAPKVQLAGWSTFT